MKSVHEIHLSRIVFYILFKTNLLEIKNQNTKHYVILKQLQ